MLRFSITCHLSFQLFNLHPLFHSLSFSKPKRTQFHKPPTHFLQTLLQSHALYVNPRQIWNTKNSQQGSHQFLDQHISETSAPKTAGTRHQPAADTHNRDPNLKRMQVWKNQPFSTNSSGRNLGKDRLGGVIFGCKNATMKECLSKQLFGLPAQHFSYVKNIVPGMPLFLFNYSDRKLHGIFEAASNGKMFIDPYGWTIDGSGTQFPAQVRIRVRLQCQPLSEDIFRPIIAQNYYSRNQFWFELDSDQSGRLICLLSSVAITPESSHKWTTIVSRPLPSHETSNEGEASTVLEQNIQDSTHSSTRPDSTENDFSLDEYIQPSDTHMVEEKVKQDEKNPAFMELKELALVKLKEFTINCENQNLSLGDNVNDTPDVNDICIEEKGYLEAPNGLKKEESQNSPFVDECNKAQLVQEVKELKDLKEIQTERICYLEQKLMEADLEIQRLRGVVTQIVPGRQF